MNECSEPNEFIGHIKPALSEKKDDGFDRTLCIQVKFNERVADPLIGELVGIKGDVGCGSRIVRHEMEFGPRHAILLVLRASDLSL